MNTDDPIGLLFAEMGKLGPGSDADTLHVLRLLPRRKFRVVVDAGCGAGRQTLALARELGTPVLAVDTHEPFLNDLLRRAGEAGVGHLVQTHCMDMKDIPRVFSGIDLLWSEGAAYNIGFANALATWAPALPPGGFAAVSELSWLKGQAPEAARDFFRSGYPDMRPVQGNVAAAEGAGGGTISGGHDRGGGPRPEARLPRPFAAAGPAYQGLDWLQRFPYCSSRGAMTATRSARSRRVFLLAVGAFCLATLVFVVARWAIIASDRQQVAEGSANEEQALQTDGEARGTAGAPAAQGRRKVLAGGQKPVVFDETSLVDFLRKERTKHGLAALLCGVWHGDDELMTVALGNSMTDEPATREMHLRVGGVTLTCVCTVLLRLVDERRVSLDDRLSRWYPKLPQAGAVTLRMLANCTSGYPDYVPSKAFIDQFYKDPFRQWRARELVDIGLATPLLYKPGTGWNYSHTNFVILGEVLQKVGGMPMAALLSRHICQPLGLKETEYPATATLRFPVLHAFSSERGIYEDSTYWSPSWTSHSGQMTSTLGDLGVLARAIGSGSLLSEKSRKEQVAPTTVGLGRNRADHYYGMGIILLNGWMVQNPRFGGYDLIFAHLPARQLSIVVATTLGPKAAPDPAYSTLIFKDMAKPLVPDTPIPEEGK